MAAPRASIVGGFVIGALALLVAGILFFGGASLFGHTMRAVIFFEGSVAGLDIGGPVTFRGVQVGSVKHIALELLPSGRARIPVIVEFTPDLVTINGQMLREGMITPEQLVGAGLRAQLNLQSIVTGQLRVDLDFRPGTPVQEEQPNATGLPRIPALPSDLERLRASLVEVPIKDLTQSLLHVLETMERVGDHLDKHMDPLLESARRGADAAARTFESAETAIGRLRADASRSLADIDRLVADTDRQIGDRGAEISHLAQSVERVARQADALLAALNSMADQHAEFRGDVEAAARDLAATAASLRGFGRSVERDPSVILRGRRGP